MLVVVVVAAPAVVLPGLVLKFHWGRKFQCSSGSDRLVLINRLVLKQGSKLTMIEASYSKP